MQRLAQDFGDRFIGIAVHTGTGEPMLIPTYPDVQTDRIPGSGVPSCIIDRVPLKLDPYSGSGQKGAFHYGIDMDFATFLNVPTEAKVDLTAQWADEFQWDVRYTVTTTFSINSPTAPYRLILVMTEDGLTGTADEWWQTNYFAAEYSASIGASYQDEDMQQWRDAPYHVKNVVYDHVAVNTWGVREGIPNSITAPITAYVPQTYTYDLTTLASHAQRLIQDRNRLHAVAMLINTETGQVVNAAQTDIRPYGADGIRTIPDDHSQPSSEDIFDLSGRRVGLPSAVSTGLYIRNGKKYSAK